jgi:hypothetical protein
MKNLPTWQKPIAWGIVIVALPFVALWRGCVAFKWTLWAGRIFIPKEAHHGRS